MHRNSDREIQTVYYGRTLIYPEPRNQDEVRRTPAINGEYVLPDYIKNHDNENLDYT